MLTKLKELKLDDNTLVVFTSDNGPWFGGSSGGLRGMKGTSWEGGYRVPFIARWPGRIPANHVSAEPAVMMDLFSTALKAAAIPTPSDRVIDGDDIMPLLTSTAKSPHDAILALQGPRIAAVRDAHWKLHILPANTRLFMTNHGASLGRSSRSRRRNTSGSLRTIHAVRLSWRYHRRRGAGDGLVRPHRRPQRATQCRRREPRCREAPEGPIRRARQRST